MQNARLARLEQGRVTMVFPIADRPLAIGRDPASDIFVSDPRASKRHASVSLRGERLFVEDLNSSNGTFVNGTAVRRGPLKSGDLIRIAATDLLIQL